MKDTFPLPVSTTATITMTTATITLVTTAATTTNLKKSFASFCVQLKIRFKRKSVTVKPELTTTFQ